MDRADFIERNRSTRPYAFVEGGGSMLLDYIISCSFLSLIFRSEPLVCSETVPL